LAKEQSKKATEPETSEKSIDSEVSELEKEIAIFSNRIATIERDSKSTIQEFNKALGSVGRQIKESLSQTVRSIRFYFWAVFVFWMLGGIGIGYALWFSPGCHSNLYGHLGHDRNGSIMECAGQTEQSSD
jgi:hypothetical protein